MNGTRAFRINEISSKDRKNHTVEYQICLCTFISLDCYVIYEKDENTTKRLSFYRRNTSKCVEGCCQPTYIVSPPNLRDTGIDVEWIEFIDYDWFDSWVKVFLIEMKNVRFFDSVQDFINNFR